MARESENRAITALEARNVAETSRLYINRLYKAIKEEAKEGRTVVYWDRTNIAVKLLEATTAELKEKGFDVSFVDVRLKISW